MSRDHESKECRCGRGVSRRGFIASMGVGAVAVGASNRLLAASGEAGAAEVTKPGQWVRVTLNVNGRKHTLLVEPRWTLLHVLREEIGLTGSKAGCERGECGACTVLMDGVPRYACMTLAVEAEGMEIVTVEGLMKGEELGEVQQAFLDEDAFQCGYCTPGQIMAVEGLLRSNPRPSLQEIQRGTSGNLCRCGAYAHIFKAADRAAKLKSGKGGES